MFRDETDWMMIGDESACAEGRSAGIIYNEKESSVVLAPTELPSDEWLSTAASTLEPQFASAERVSSEREWAPAPSMRITAVHGLDDDDPAMAAALRQLNALA
jgi:hypothetical protein